MSELPLCFDAVLFDLDGTLVATDGFWVDAARAGAKRAFAELGLEGRELPTPQEWMSLVGLPLARGFEQLFDDLPPAAIAHVRRRCVEEESFALQAGRARLLPGAAEALEELARQGLALGIASNCGKDYLSEMMRGLTLGRWVSEARCLDSAGVSDKGDMVADLLRAFATRSAVMVGDRAGDREAAHVNGLPHVHVTRGFAPPGEDVAAEGTIDDLSELVPRLADRGRWIEGAARALGLFERDRPSSIGVSGPPGAGKSLFARDLVRVLSARGVAARQVELAGYARQAACDPPADRPLELFELAFDVERLEHDLRAARARGAGETLVLDGPFLTHPRLAQVLERIVCLTVDEGLALRRLGGRDAHALGPEALMRARRTLLPAQRALDELRPPARHAHLVLEAGNPLGPARPLKEAAPKG